MTKAEEFLAKLNALLEEYEADLWYTCGHGLLVDFCKDGKLVDQYDLEITSGPLKLGTSHAAELIR